MTPGVRGVWDRGQPQMAMSGSSLEAVGPARTPPDRGMETWVDLRRCPGERYVRFPPCVQRSGVRRLEHRREACP